MVKECASRQEREREHATLPNDRLLSVSRDFRQAHLPIDCGHGDFGRDRGERKRGGKIFERRQQPLFIRLADVSFDERLILGDEDVFWRNGTQA
jgi:hypothetical protein